MHPQTPKDHHVFRPLGLVPRQRFTSPDGDTVELRGSYLLTGARRLDQTPLDELPLVPATPDGIIPAATENAEPSSTLLPSPAATILLILFVLIVGTVLIAWIAGAFSHH